MKMDIFEPNDLAQVLAWACQRIEDRNICPAKAYKCPFGKYLPCEKVGAADWLAVLKAEEDNAD